MTIKHLFILYSFILLSCDVQVGNSCEWEKTNYAESWDYIIKRVYRYERYQATYAIETTSGKKILFRPKQYLVTIADPGDYLVKAKNSNMAYIIFHDTGDSIPSRIFSETCDSIVEAAFK